MSEHRYIQRDRNDRYIMGGDRVRNYKTKAFGVVIRRKGAWCIETLKGFEPVTREWTLFEPAKN